MSDLKYIIEQESFITSPLLITDSFISYCKDRDIATSRRQLEQFEKLELFYPIARIQYPRIKIKIDKSNRAQLGILQDGEEWNGEVEDSYSDFRFEKDFALSWLEDKLLWDPASRPFQPWKEFYDENGTEIITSYYSIFQCYALYLLTQQTSYKTNLEWWPPYGDQDIHQKANQMAGVAKAVISGLQKDGVWRKKAPLICQILSSRYFPDTQSDRRSIQVSISGDYIGKWDWHKFRGTWAPRVVLNDVKMSVDEVKSLQEQVALVAQSLDPLEQWYEIVSFASLAQKKRLKGKALLAQSIYSMEQMLRLFYKDLTGTKLPEPDESYIDRKDHLYGESVTQNELRSLEFLANKYRLNPRPDMILVIEGDGEEAQLPRLATELFGLSFHRLGIEVHNLEGIGNFEGNKTYDKYSALVRFIDHHHFRLTFVFILLDNEGRTATLRNRLIQARSSYYPQRRVTKADYVHLWRRNIEFDNFSPIEIAQAMTSLSVQTKTPYNFQPEEITLCQVEFDRKKQDYLSNLFEEKCRYGLNKPALLHILFGYIISNASAEFDAEGKALRPVVSILRKIMNLASLNHQPTDFNAWKENQESGYFGDLIK